MEELTIKDVARLSGFGVSTVSRAINNHPDINKETKDKIMAVIEEYGYIPNNSARNLKRTEANSIAVLIKGIDNPFLNSMVATLEEAIEERKHSLVLRHVEMDQDEIDVALQLTKEKRLKGIVFLGGHFTHSEEKLKKLHVPFVLSTVGGSPENMSKKRYSSVSVDDEKESSRMVQYLIDQGHKDIAILSAESEDTSIGLLRLQGYKKTLLKNNIPVRDELIVSMRGDIPYYSMENGYQTMKTILNSGLKCSAIFALSDLMAVGACRAIIEAGKRVPEDYAVAGFDGIDLGKYYIPSITTISQPAEKMARKTIEILFSTIDEENKNQHVVYEGELIERESTRK